MENRFSPGAARHHVVKGTGELKSKAARHAGKLAGEREICQDFYHDPIHLGENGMVEAWLEWDGHGRVMRMPLTEAVMLADPASGEEKSTLPGGLWMYNGSRLIEGRFQADQSGSLVSIIRDPDALINNPGARRDNDEIHVPNAAKLPKLQTPVRVVMRVR